VVADSPLGPYADLGVYIDEYPGNSGTIHGSVVKFRNEWLAFYHSGWVSGTQTSRSLMMDRLNYTEDGSIQRITPTESSQGRGEIDDLNWTIVLDAAAALGAGGRLYGTQVVNSDPKHLGRNPDGSTGAGYVKGLVQQEYGVSVLLQIGPAREYEVWLRYRSTEARNGRVLAGRHLFYDGNQNQSYEQYVNRGTAFPSTEGHWREILIGSTVFQPGEYQVRLSHSHNLPEGASSLDVDCFIFRPVG